jgi:AraC-like DNA-binding protein/ligand-binding sensor protein
MNSILKNTETVSSLSHRTQLADCVDQENKVSPEFNGTNETKFQSCDSHEDPTGDLLEKLRDQKSYKDYAHAFSATTGLPIALRHCNSWQLPFRNLKNENTFCSMINSKNNRCLGCSHFQKKMTTGLDTEPCTMSCPFGLIETAIPVQHENKLLGILQIGQIFHTKPSEKKFQNAVDQVTDAGIVFKIKKLRETFFATRVIGAKQYASVVQLVSFFAQQLVSVTYQISVRAENKDPSAIKAAREFMHQHQAEPLSLGAVAREAHMSSYYFCKMFKKTTGLNFTSYLSHLRIEKAKNLLLNPNLRISEIAFEIGFESLGHFNRVFHTLVGKSPTGYRAHLPIV